MTCVRISALQISETKWSEVHGGSQALELAQKAIVKLSRDIFLEQRVFIM